jgi:hypothetical protein
MTNGPRILIALLMLANGLLAGCGASPLTPSLAPPAGVLELTTNHPAGATLAVNPNLCVEPENEPVPCTRDLQLTFSVVLNRDLDRVRVSTQFYTTSGHLCAATTTESVSVTAGTPATLTASSVCLWLPGSSPECGLPVQTTRMVAHLFQDGGPAVGDLLTQEFSKAYTFTNP